jgi:histidine triad (HIT) family protein
LITPTPDAPVRAREDVAMADCLFCSIVAGQVPAEIVYRDDRTVAFRDIHPQAPTHVLIVPVRHIVNAGTVVAEDADDVAALLLAAQAVADAEGIGGADRGYRLVLNVGPDAMNSVDHLHLHVLGGRVLDGSPG